jgi:Amt family ammonium transporter
MGAIVLGLVAGVVCFIACSAIKSVLGYDDALDVFGVHCIGGIVGALGTGILAAPILGGSGIFDYATGKAATEYDMLNQLWVQFKTVCLTLVWSGVGTLILLTLLRVAIGLRPATDPEREGLDLVDHGERAYNY